MDKKVTKKISAIPEDKVMEIFGGVVHAGGGSGGHDSIDTSSEAACGGTTTDTYEFHVNPSAPPPVHQRAPFGLTGPAL